MKNCANFGISVTNTSCKKCQKQFDDFSKIDFGRFEPQKYLKIQIWPDPPNVTRGCPNFFLLFCSVFFSIFIACRLNTKYPHIDLHTCTHVSTTGLAPRTLGTRPCPARASPAAPPTARRRWTGSRTCSTRCGTGRTRTGAWILEEKGESNKNIQIHVWEQTFLLVSFVNLNYRSLFQLRMIRVAFSKEKKSKAYPNLVGTNVWHYFPQKKPNLYIDLFSAHLE